LAQFDTTLLKPYPPGLPALRRARHWSLSSVAPVFYCFLEGYGADMETGAINRPHQQQSRLQPKELPLGYPN
jgi:hypothetical protein